MADMKESLIRVQQLIIGIGKGYDGETIIKTIYDKGGTRDEIGIQLLADIASVNMLNKLLVATFQHIFPTSSSDDTTTIRKQASEDSNGDGLSDSSGHEGGETS